MCYTVGMKKIWLWIAAAVAAVAGAILLVVTGNRKATPLPPPTPERPDTPPVDPPLVKLKPSTEYEDDKVKPNGALPHVVITNINERHK
jgi:hypothetical protein